MAIIPDEGKRPLLERLIARLDMSGDCWLYRGGTNGRYGVTSKSLTREQVYAHRAMYELAIGEIPEGMMVCHRCDTPLCARPSHLFLGDQSTNMADAASKGRTSRGCDRHSARLDPDIVRQIRHRVAAGESRKSLAAEYGVSIGHIDMIVTRKRWAHVD